MVTWQVSYSRSALTDAKLLKQAGLGEKAKALVELISQNPYQTPPPCEKLVGNLKGKFSRRINQRHRLVYEVLPEACEILVIWMFKHPR